MSGGCPVDETHARCGCGGVVEHMPFQEYLAVKAVSQSGLKVLGMGTPADYRAYMDRPFKQTKAMFLGSLVDCLVLEPDEFKARYWLPPAPIDLDCPFCGVLAGHMCITKKGATSERFHPERKGVCPGGLEPVESKVFAQASGMAQEVLNHPTAGPIVRRSQKQVSMFWTDEETGLACKGRPDLINGIELWDLKTCGKGRAAPEVWGLHAADLGYHYQAGFYVDGFIEAKQFDTVSPHWGWICVESAHPYKVAVYEASEDWILEGRECYRTALRTLAWCEGTDQWTGYDSEVQVCEFPKYKAGAGRVEGWQSEEDSDE
jgi:hypothetical protein